MMRFSTSTSIYQILIGIQDNAANDALIEKMMDNVGGKVAMYCGGRYTVSDWTTEALTPQAITQISDALISMHVMRSLFTQDAQNQNKWVTELGEQALKDLAAISKGEVFLTDNDGARLSNANQIKSTTESYHNTFDEGNPLSWIEDSDKLDDLADEKS